MNTLIAIEIVAEGLGELKERCFLTGGVSIPFYITDSTGESPRVTLDIDVAIEVSSAREFHEVIEARLRERGFRHDISGFHICRWKWDGITVDIMPIEKSILRFTNPWYKAGLADTMPIAVSRRCQWRVLSAPFALAAKFEAFGDRGAQDPSQSSDLEDILTIVNGRPELTEEVKNTTQECRNYIAEWCARLLLEHRFRDVLEHHLPLAGQHRLPVIIERLNRLSRSPQVV